MDRTAYIQAMRPAIHASVDAQTSTNEAFQQSVLRPTIKMQSEVLMVALHTALEKHMHFLQQIPDAEKSAAVQTWLNTNTKVMATLHGMLMGMFTVPELEYYLQNKKELDKRIKHMLSQRFAEKAVRNVKK